MSTQPIQPPLADNFGIVAQSMGVYGRRLPVLGMHFVGHKIPRPYKTKVDEPYSHIYELKAIESIDDHPSLLWVFDAFERVFQGSDDYGNKRYSEVATDTTAALVA